MTGLVEYQGLLLTPWQKQVVEQAMKTRSARFSYHSLGGGYDLSWSGEDLLVELYDHKVWFTPGRKIMSMAYQFGNNRRVAPVREVKPRAVCECGWKNTGYDADVRGQAHIDKLRAWLDEHPEEEVMAGLGGQITWPPKPKKHKNKSWNKKR